MNIRSLGWVVVLAFAGTQALANAQVRFGGWALQANGQLAKGFQYTGSCPVSLKFDWGVMSNAPTDIHYIFERSDGGHGPAQSRHIDQANHSLSVTEDWHLGANTPQFANYHGWLQMNIEEPNRVSHRIAFTIHCK